MSELSRVLPFAAPLTGAPDTGPAPAAPDRRQLEALAEEFESLLLLQVIRQMRAAIAGFGDEDDSQAIGGDLSAMTDTIDGELARYLSRAGGFGLSGFLERSLSRPFETAGAAVAPPGEATPGRPAAELAAAASVASGSARPNAPQPEGAGEVEPALTYAGTVTSPFGWRTDPLIHRARFHGGVDIRAAYGQDVPAAGGGRVMFAAEQGGYGLTVVVEHPNGLRTRYAHLSALAVREGDEVADGQAVGRAGRSGRATGPHVHLELTANGRPLDPMAIVRPAEFKKMALRADSSSGLVRDSDEGGSTR